jgi:uncharacterized protein (TIGR02118 family)
MILVTVMYPAGEKFDTDYYLTTHMPLVKDRWGPLGLKSAQAIKGMGKPDGSTADYQMIALLTFGSMDDFKAAGKAHGKEIFDDIPKFTSAQAVVQINDVVF